MSCGHSCKRTCQNVSSTSSKLFHYNALCKQDSQKGKVAAATATTLPLLHPLLGKRNGAAVRCVELRLHLLDDAAGGKREDICGHNGIHRRPHCRRIDRLLGIRDLEVHGFIQVCQKRKLQRVFHWCFPLEIVVASRFAESGAARGRT